MNTPRYNHCCVYDEKWGRIHVLGGVGEEGSNIESSSTLSSKSNCYLQTCEIYDIRNDTW